MAEVNNFVLRILNHRTMCDEEASLGDKVCIDAGSNATEVRTMLINMIKLSFFLTLVCTRLLCSRMDAPLQASVQCCTRNKTPRKLCLLETLLRLFRYFNLRETETEAVMLSCWPA